MRKLALSLAAATVIVTSILAFSLYTNRNRTFVDGTLSKLSARLPGAGLGGYEWINTNTIFYLRQSSTGSLTPIYCHLNRWPQTETNFLAPLFLPAIRLGHNANFWSAWKALPNNSSLIIRVLSGANRTVYIANLTNETYRPLNPQPIGEIFETPDGQIFHVESEQKKGSKYTYRIRTSENRPVKTFEEDAYGPGYGFDFKGRFVLIDTGHDDEGYPTKLELIFHSLTADPPETIHFDLPPKWRISNFALSSDGTKFAVSGFTSKRLSTPLLNWIWLIDLKSATKTLLYKSTNYRSVYSIRFAPHGISFFSNELFLISPTNQPRPENWRYKSAY